MQTTRVWGYARTITDTLWSEARVDVEVLQAAVFGIPPGAETTQFLRVAGQKRRRHARRSERARKRRIDDLVLQVANSAADVALRRREEEEENERRREDEEEVQEEEEGPYDPREHHSDDEEGDEGVTLRPRDGRLSPVWGLAARD